METAAVVISESAEMNVGLDHTVETVQAFLPDIPVVPLPRIVAATESWRVAPALIGLVRQMK